MYTLLLEAENPQEDVPVIVQPEPEQPKKGVIDRILEDDGIMMVVVGIMGVSPAVNCCYGQYSDCFQKEKKRASASRNNGNTGRGFGRSYSGGWKRRNAAC